MEAIEKKKKLLEIFKKAMMPVEEPESTTVEANITIVLTAKEEAETDAVLKKIFDSK
jgi:lauroyl/myristoyl acyltransferase